MTPYEELKKRLGKGESSGSETSGKKSAVEELRERLGAKRFEEDVRNVDSSYIDRFVSSANSYFGSAGEAFDKVGWGNATQAYLTRRDSFNDLDYRRKVIQKWMENNREQMDPESYQGFYESLENFGVDASGILDSFSGARDFYNQFETEDDYLAYLDYQEKSKFDLEAGQKEIDSLKEKRDTMNRGSRPPANSYLTGETNPASSPYGAARQQGTEQEKALAELNRDISRKSQYLNQSRYIQDGIAMAGVTENADFGKYSGYQSTELEGTWDRATSKLGMGYGDLTYEFINGGDTGVRDAIIKKAITLGNFDQKVFAYAYMTEDQIAIYNYHYAKEGREAAEKYLNSIQESLNYKLAEARFGQMKDKTGLEMLFGVEAGLDQFKTGISSFFNSFFKKDDYIPQTAVQMASGMVREDLKTAGPNRDGWIGGALPAHIGYDVITTTTNMAPSMLTSMAFGMINPAAGAIAGNALMFASSAGNAYQDALNRGYDKGQARMYSALVGGSEVGLQYFLGGISSLGGKVSGNAVKSMLEGVDNAFLRFAGKLGGSMVSEGIEEGLQEILTPMFENMVLYADKNVNWSDVAYSVLLGSLTAGFMEGPSVVKAETGTYETGRSLQRAGISAERLAGIGNTFAADTVAHQLAGRVNENTGAYTLGRLFNEIGATMTEQNVNDITQALVEKGMSENVARANARAVAAVVEGEKLTDLQVAVIEANDTLAEAVRTAIIDPNATWFQRTKGYNETLMALAQEKTAPKATRTNPAEAGQENAPASDKADSETEVGTEGIASPAKVKSIASVKDGKVTVKMEDGNEVDAVDADLDPEEGVIIETIAKIGGISVNDANYILGMVKAAPGVNSQWSALGAAEAYRYGFYGMSEEHMAKHGVFSNTIAGEMRGKIYAAGRNARQTQVDAKQETVAKNTTADKKAAVGDKNAITGKVHFEGDRSSLTPRQSESLTAMEKIADIMGVQIHVFESRIGKDGKRIGANGWYDPRDNSIHIDLHAGQNGEGTMLFTLAHELTHHIRKWSPAKFKILADFLMEEYGKQGVNVDGLIRAQMAKAKRGGRTISYDTAYEEMVADSMEMMLADGNVLKRLEKLKARDKDLWHKIKSFIDDLAAKIRNVYKGLTPDSVEGRYVADMGKAVYKMQELFAEALADANENFQNAGVQKNTTDDGGDVQYSLREFEDGTRFVDVQMDAHTFDGLTVAEMNKAAKAILMERFAGKVIGIDNRVFVNGDSVNEYLHPSKSIDMDTRKAKLTAAGELDNLLDAGKALPNKPDGEDGHIHPDAIDFSYFKTIFKVGNEYFEGIVNIKNIKRGKLLKDITKIRNITQDIVSSYGQNPKSNFLRDGSMYSIRNESGIVKRESAEAVEQADRDLEAEVKFSIREQFYQEFDAWDKKNTHVSFVTGTTSDVLKSIGMKDQNIVLRSGTVLQKLKDHPEMTLDIFKGIPELLEHPVIVQFSDAIDPKTKRPKYDSSITVLGELYADVVEGGKTVKKPVLVSLELLPTKNKGTTVLNFAIIKSAYSKNALQQYLNENSILYIDPDKKRTDSWLSLTRLQLPFGENRYGPIRKIAYVDGKVKVQSPKNMSEMQKKLYEAGIIDEFGNKLFSDRDTESVSDRSLLADAFEGVAQNDIERNRLQEYKGKIDAINAEEQKLQELNRQIRELSFSKGPRDAKKISELRDEATKTANRISIYDKQLLRLEASKPLQAVLEREKKKAYQMAEKKGRDALAAYRLQAEAKQSETLRDYRETRAALRQQKSDTDLMEKEFLRIAKAYETLEAKAGAKTAKDAGTIAGLKDALKEEARKHNADQKTWEKEFNRLVREYEASGRNITKLEEKIERQKANAKARVESREKTAVRHKIQRVVKELNDLLLNESKKRHVPDSLKKAVAEALSLVNMDTVGAEERIAKYEALIAQETDQDKIDAYTVTLENIRRKGEDMAQRLKALRDAYDEIQESDDPDIANAYDPVIAGSLKELSQSIGNTPLREMTIEQLSDVYDMYRMVLTRVRDANKAFLNGRNETISELASRVAGEVRRAGGEHARRVSALDPVRKFLWNNLKPVYAFEHLGSSTLTEAFNGVRKGEDTWAEDVTEAREYYLDKSRKYGYDKWDFKKKYRFESDSGIEFELTLEQILSLYAYSKREQAHEHLRLGGFVFDSNIETYEDGKLIKYKVNTADAHQITPEILADIISSLSKEQMAFVDEMQEYLSTTMGAKGNEVTMAMYGVKLFKEKHYFPLKSAKQFMFEQNEVSGEVRIKNSGFTNKTVAKANNPVILSNFMDVWSGHVNDMSMYHAFVLPLEDFNRIFNYNSPKKEGQASVSVKGTIQSAYSPAAVQYVKNLITDLNGGAVSDPRESTAKAMMSKFKKAKVMASLSVVIQQPSAIARAFALIEPKYFRPTKDGMNHKQLWDELKRYAPVAVIKEMGYFDTNMGRSAQDFITAREYSGFGEKAKAIFTDSGFRDEALSKLPALADEMTWCAIWNAVKRETVTRHSNLRPGSEEFLKAAGERFTEVVTKTQVYDSVLARSSNMRSKSGLMSMATSFMAEPTTTINMLEDAIRKARRGNKRYAAKAFASVATSIVLNNALVGLVYAMRDDDEDETYLEKYAESFVSGMIDDLNPLTYYPFLKDMWSLLQGYDIERADMSLFSDLSDAMKKLVKEYAKEDGDLAGAWMGLAGTVADLGGVPLKNIKRDIDAVINFYRTLRLDVNGRKTTLGSMTDVLQESVRSTLPVVGWIPGESKADKLYDAMISGDAAYLNRLKSGYKDESDVNSAVRSAIRDRFTAGDLSYEDALSYLVKYAGMDEDDAYWKLEEWEYESSSDEEFGKYNEFFEAVQTGKNLKAVIKQYTDNGVKESSLKSQISEHFKPLYMEMSKSEKAKIKGYLLNAMTVLGDTREEAEKRIGEWEFESKYGFKWSERDDAYKSGEVSAYELKKILMDVGGKTEAEAELQITVYDWQKEGLDISNNAKNIIEGYRNCEYAGIDKKTYYDFYTFYSEAGEDTVRNSKVKECMPYINSLPLTAAQKDAIALSIWAASTVNRYKTW